MAERPWGFDSPLSHRFGRADPLFWTATAPLTGMLTEEQIPKEQQQALLEAFRGRTGETRGRDEE